MFTYKDHSLLKYNTFGIDVKADYLVECSELEEIQHFISSRKYQGLPLLVLGGGSNVLLTGDYHGVVLLFTKNSVDHQFVDDEHVIVKASGGLPWDNFVSHCVSMGWGGLENLSLIPGTVGSSPIQNIGAYGVEIKDSLVELEAIDLQSGELMTFSNSDCHFGYRDSIFKKELKGRAIIVSVTFGLSRKPEININYESLQKEFAGIRSEEITINAVRDAVIRIRKSKLPDPKQHGNAGSFFKNPSISHSEVIRLKSAFPAIPVYPQVDGSYKVSAGWLIEQCGWKGRRVGSAGVYDKQALVLVNYGGATGQEVLELAESIRNAVNTSFGINLETEVNII